MLLRVTFHTEIASYFQSQGHEVQVVTPPPSTPQEVYTVSRLEKDLRTTLKSTVERLLSPTSIVLLDWLNYIKGYRYELYCLVRNVQTTMTVVYCELETDVAVGRGKWPEALCRDLASRMEVPNPKNRWDSPLFSLRPDEPTPLEDIARAVLEGKLPRPRFAPIAIAAMPNPVDAMLASPPPDVSAKSPVTES